MDYLLIVLTHDGGATLRRCLESFVEQVTPPPTDAVLIEDGPHMVPVEWWTGRRVNLGRQQGFCKAVAAGWLEAQRSECPFVFWLEHDFLFHEPVDLRDVAAVLGRNRHLAQMSLLRQPVSPAEIARGGILNGFAHHRCEDFMSGADWIEHDEYWTTNPSLFPQPLARYHDWPEGPECEGRFGQHLRANGYSFGVWGHGQQQVEYIGERAKGD